MGKQTVINQVESCLRSRVKVVSEKEVWSLMEMNGKKVCFAIYMREATNVMIILLSFLVLVQDFDVCVYFSIQRIEFYVSQLFLYKFFQMIYHLVTVPKHVFSQSYTVIVLPWMTRFLIFSMTMRWRLWLLRPLKRSMHTFHWDCSENNK